MANDSSENRQRGRDPDRDRQRDAVTRQVVARLEERGVDLDGRESSEELAELLDASDAFEAAVDAIGGDRMVDDPWSSRPEHDSYVMPPRAADESAWQYAGRLRRLADRLRRLAE